MIERTAIDVDTLQVMVEALDPFGSDLEGDEVMAVWNEVMTELMPHRAPRTLEEWRTSGGSFMDFESVGARADDGSLAGVVIVGRFVDGSNPDTAIVFLLVPGPHRRRGIGTVLLARAVESVRRTGQRTLVTDVYDTVPAGAAFAERFGATPGLVSRAVGLDLTQVDRSALDGWMQRGADRSPAYDIRVYEGRYPEDHIEDIARMIHDLEHDMPLDDLEIEPLTVDVARLREDRERGLETFEYLMTLAIESESARPVGMSEVYRSRSTPHQIRTSITGVVRSHRGHALGMRLKVELIDRVRDRWPDATLMITENAGSNEAMRGINDVLGFRYLNTETAYQADIAVVAARLEDRGVTT